MTTTTLNDIATDEAPSWARPGAADMDGGFGEPGGASSRFAIKDKFAGMADEGKNQLLQTFDGLIQAAHEFADRLESGAGGPVADYARQAAHMLGDWQSAIQAKSVEELVDDGRDFVRRQPVAALGIAVGAGFILSRLLRSSQ